MITKKQTTTYIVELTEKEARGLNSLFEWGVYMDAILNEGLENLYKELNKELGQAKFVQYSTMASR